MTVMTSREFNQDTGRAKKAAHEGPVFITDDGQQAYVLMTMADFLKRSASPPSSVADAFAMPNDTPDVDFDPPRIDGPAFKAVDFDD